MNSNFNTKRLIRRINHKLTLKSEKNPNAMNDSRSIADWLESEIQKARVIRPGRRRIGEKLMFSPTTRKPVRFFSPPVVRNSKFKPLNMRMDSFQSERSIFSSRDNSRNNSLLKRTFVGAKLKPGLAMNSFETRNGNMMSSNNFNSF